MRRRGLAWLGRALGDALRPGARCCAGAAAETAGEPHVRPARGQPPRRGLPRKQPMRQAASSADGEVAADVRYRSSSRILLVGEANFTFASALCRRFGDCSGLTACSLETREALLERFGDGIVKRLSELERRLCGVHHSLPVAQLPERFRPASFDCVAFNFPLPASPPQPEGEAPGDGADPGVRREQHAAQLRGTYVELSALLAEFFRGAAYVLRPGGECHLRLTDQHVTAPGLRSAQDFGFRFCRRVDFCEAFEKVYKPLGYRPSAVISAGQSRRKAARAGFGVQHSSTLVFSRDRNMLS